MTDHLKICFKKKGVLFKKPNHSNNREMEGHRDVTKFLLVLYILKQMLYTQILACGYKDHVHLSIVIDTSDGTSENDFGHFRYQIISDVLDLLRRNRTNFAMSVCRFDNNCNTSQDKNRCFYYEKNPATIRTKLTKLEYADNPRKFNFSCSKNILAQIQRDKIKNSILESYKSVNIILTHENIYKAFLSRDGSTFFKLENDRNQLPLMIYKEICYAHKTKHSSSFYAHETKSSTTMKTPLLVTMVTSIASNVINVIPSRSPIKTTYSTILFSSAQIKSFSKSCSLLQTYVQSTIDKIDYSSQTLETSETLGTKLTSFTEYLRSIQPSITTDTKRSSTSQIKTTKSLITSSFPTSNKLITLQTTRGIHTSKQRSVSWTDKILPSKSQQLIVTSAIGNDLEQLNKEIDGVLNTTADVLQNKTLAKEFVKESADLIERTINIQTPDVKVEKLLKFLEESFKTIGSFQLPGERLIYKKRKTVVEIATFEEGNFPGYNYSSENQGVDVILPKDIFKKTVSDGEAVVVVIMENPTPYFMKSVSRYSTSKILSINTQPQINGILDKPFTYTLPKEVHNGSYKCVFWNISLSAKEKWDTKGCTRVTTKEENEIKCQCNHMTSFSLLLQTEDIQIPKDHETALSIITYIGCGVSIFACIALILLYMGFGRVMQYDRNLVHMNLCIAIAVSNSLFLVAGNVADHKDLCLGISVSLLYSCMACFFWMFIEGFHVYSMVVKVFNRNNRWKMYMVVGWLCPAIIVSIIAARYHKHFTRSYFCWISTDHHLIWAFIAPVLIVIIANTYILIRTLRASYKMDRRNDVVQKSKRLAHLSIILMPVFGVTWIFGFFSINNRNLIFFQYIFNLLNSFQGLFIFIFYALLNNDLKREYEKFRRASSYFSTPRSSETTLDDISHKRWSQMSVKRLFKSKENVESEDNVFYLQTKSL